MAWTKAPQSLIDLFDISLPQPPGLQLRRMFGYPVAFVNGHMCAGLFQDRIFARLPPRLRRELERGVGARPFEPLPGRPMRDYLLLPESLLEDERRLVDVLAAACAFTGGLPPKTTRPPKSRPRRKVMSRSLHS